MHDSKIAPEVLERVRAWRGKLHLYDEIDGARTALIVIDMQNHWLKEGCPGYAPGAVDIVPNINRLADAMRSAGGTVAWVAAARLAGLACAAPYYGGGMPGFIGEKPRAPVMCHFGEKDQSPTLEQAKQIATAFEQHPWVDGDVRVEISVPARIEVQFEYRRPVAMVEIQDGFYAVDDAAILAAWYYATTTSTGDPKTGLVDHPLGIYLIHKLRYVGSAGYGLVVRWR